MNGAQRDNWIAWLRHDARTLRRTYRMGRIPTRLELLAEHLETERDLELYRDGYGPEVLKAIIEPERK